VTFPIVSPIDFYLMGGNFTILPLPNEPPNTSFDPPPPQLQPAPPPVCSVALAREINRDISNPAFLREVLASLPGVNPDDERFAEFFG
jgi:hypothetical protein